MARADSLIFFLTGFAQLIIASEIETALVAAILQGTGSGMLALGAVSYTHLTLPTKRIV